MRVRALPLVAVMWVVTGAGLAAVALGPASPGQPSAPPGHVAALLMVWMTILVVSAFLRIWVAPVQVEAVRLTSGAEEALRRAESYSESIWYLLGLSPLTALAALGLTGWAAGAAALWLGGLVAMLLLAPDAAALERVAVGSR